MKSTNYARCFAWYLDLVCVKVMIFFYLTLSTYHVYFWQTSSTFFFIDSSINQHHTIWGVWASLRSMKKKLALATHTDICVCAQRVIMIIDNVIFLARSVFAQTEGFFFLLLLLASALLVNSFFLTPIWIRRVYNRVECPSGCRLLIATPAEYYSASTPHATPPQSLRMRTPR